jgi:RNAse (barnase) inhibitor barstar
MIKKIWKDSFEAIIKENARVISKEDINDIIDMLIADKIDLQIFISNLGVLIRGHLSPFSFSGAERKDPSSSIIYYPHGDPICRFSITCRAPAIPLWFYAAYPDVMKWFHEWQKNHKLSNNFDDYKFVIETMKLFEIKEVDLEKENVFNKEKQYKPEYLKNLVKNYLEKNRNDLEVAVEEFSESDIYTGQEMLETLGTESNFTLIAEITTKFYLELEKEYKSFFTDQVSLLATAGVLDAQWDVFSGKIKPVEIVTIAKEAVKSNNPLLNFIVELEVKLLGVDTPNMDENTIRKACEEQKEIIKNSIQKTKKEYKGEPRIIFDTKTFINSDKFDQIKKELGILKGNGTF